MKKKRKRLKENELIHVKLEYVELLQAKRDLLSLQMELLKIVKIVRKYHFFRIEELKKKEILYKRIKQTNIKIRKLQVVLPKLHVPKMLKHPHERKQKKVREARVSSDDNLESQLQEIQNRLNELQR